MFPCLQDLHEWVSEHKFRVEEIHASTRTDDVRSQYWRLVVSAEVHSPEDAKVRISFLPLRWEVLKSFVREDIDRHPENQA